MYENLLCEARLLVSLSLSLQSLPLSLSSMPLSRRHATIVLRVPGNHGTLSTHHGTHFTAVDSADPLTLTLTPHPSP